MNRPLKNHVIIFSGANFVAYTLIEYLISKGLSVTVATNDKYVFEEQLKHINIKHGLVITNNFKDLEPKSYSYSILLVGFDKKISTRYKINPIAKTIFIIPMEKREDYSKYEILNENISIIYVSDVYGPRIDLDGPTYIEKIVKGIVKDRKINTPVGEVLFPIYVNDLVKKIFGYMFSFGPYGKRIKFLGNQMSTSEFWKLQSNFIKNIGVEINTKSRTRKIPQEIETHTINSDNHKGFLNTYKWIFSINNNQSKTKNVNNTNLIYLKTFFYSVVILLISPFVSLLISLGILFLSFKNYSTDKINLAQPFIVYSQKSSYLFTNIPYFGVLYNELDFAANTLQYSSQLYKVLYPTMINLTDLFSKIVGNDTYDINSFYNVSVDNFSISFSAFTLLVNEINKTQYKQSFLRNELLKRYDLMKLYEQTSYLHKSLKSLNTLLGSEKKQTYLILFQNNMELRPTGGFIGSFGLSSFEKGRLVELNVSDVYSADGQLKGHVEPPQPIKDYLGEANWYLRDSNWDPDFPVSARKAEWFLDKEIGVSVDGVIAIDLTPIKNILEITGPIFLSDYNMDITSENLYEKTQEEVEGKFFPGSRKKASFLTALSRNLLNEFPSLDSIKKIELVKTVYSNLERRHIQIYMHDQKFQKHISSLNWDGSFKSDNCNNTCYADQIAVVEANLGVNKVNQFIKRSYEVNVVIKDGVIKRSLVVKIENKANNSLGPSGEYQVYTKIFKNKDSVIEKDWSWNEILPMSNENILFEWESPYPTNLESKDYKVYIRKQAGIESAHLNLTVNGKNLYNGQLVQDLFLQYE